ncbi:MAG: mechanosensitive ion channel family protein, partial [Anaerolineae bacterium]
MQESVFWHDFKSFLLQAGWIVEILFGIVALVAISYLFKRLPKFIKRRSLVTPHPFLEKIESISNYPLKLILWSIGVAFVIDVLAKHFNFEQVLDIVQRLRNATVVFSFAWLLFRWKTEMQNAVAFKMVHGKPVIDPGIIQVLGRLFSIFIVFIAGVIVLQILGLNIIPLVAFGGVGAAALGFAGKDVIANFFGGLMLHITRPFAIGDLILLPDRNIEGQVEGIGWYLTSIRDKDKRSVYLPNAIFSTISVMNISRMTHRRIEERISLGYGDFAKVQTLVEEIR